MVVRLGGTVVVMRAIGPADYGVFSAAAAFVLFASALAQMGIEVFLIRAKDEPTPRRYDEAFTFLLVTSVAVTAVGLLLTVPLAGLLRPVGVVTPLRVLILLVPINVLWAPAQACIERRFGYRSMGMLELGGDVALYATAVPLALGGLGAWALVVGYFAWQTWLLVGSVAVSGLRPRLVWSSQTSRELLRHGFTYSVSNWASSGSQVVVAIVVGTFAGPIGVGYVNFSTRLVSMLNFTKRGVFRVGMVAVARARSGGVARLARALEEGSFLVMVAAAAPFAAFGLVARWMVPIVFGSSWIPAVELCAVVSVVSVLGVIGLVQGTVLYAVGDNVSVARASVLHLVVLAVAAVVLVPPFGVLGYAAAGGVALVSTVVTHRATTTVAPMRYRRMTPVLVVLVPPMLAPLAPFPGSLLTLVPALLALVLPATRREVRFLGGLVHTAVSGRMSSSQRGGGPEQASTEQLGGEAATGAPRAAGGEAVPTQTVAAAPEAASAPPPVVAGPQMGAAGAGWPHRGGTRSDRSPVARLAGDAQGADHWLLPPDAVTGAASLDVMLARAGRLLGAVRGAGWPVLVGAFEVAPVQPGSELDDRTLRAVAEALRSDLRFDDPVARAHPATFVVATALVPGGADGPEVAGQLARSVGRVLAGSDDGHPSGVLRWSWVVTGATSNEEIDDLLRRVAEDLHVR